MKLEIFVSNNNGITLENAIKEANEKRNDYDEIIIILGEGEFFREKTVELTKKELQSGKAKIIFRGTGDKKTVISGGVALDYKDFEIANNDRIRPEMKNKILSLDLKKYGITEVGKPFIRDSWYDIITSQAELFVDDEEADIVTFPKNKKRIKINEEDIVKKCVPFTDEEYPDPYAEKADVMGRCPILRYNFSEADRWGMAHDAYLYGFPSAVFFSFSVPIDIDTTKKPLLLKN